MIRYFIFELLIFGDISCRIHKIDNVALLLILLCPSYGKTKAEVEMVDVRADRIYEGTLILCV